MSGKAGIRGRGKCRRCPVARLGGLSGAAGRMNAALALAVIGLSTSAAGQRGPSRQTDSCAPVRAARGAAITFGQEGGLLRPRTVQLFANGLVRAGGDSATDSVTTLKPEAVAGLARLARTGGFWGLATPATRPPPRNPDAARAFIAVNLSCGAHRVEYVMGEPTPAAFAEFQALLEAVTGSASGH